VRRGHRVAYLRRGMRRVDRMSGLSDLYDFTPEQRMAIVRVEELRRMREVVREWRGTDSLMPAATVEVQLPPCAETVVAGAYQEQAA
jgi:hypothetical protein